MESNSDESAERARKTGTPPAAGAGQAASTPLLAPVVSSVTPSCGPVAGGTLVAITGVGLSGTSTVRFGTSAATAVTVISPTMVTVVNPPHTAGTVTVTVTTPAGTATGSYTYGCLSPTVTSLCPDESPICGGTRVTVIGTDLTGATAVTFGGSPGSGIVVDPSGCSLTVACPPNRAGSCDVRVTTPSGTSSASDGGRFSYVCAELFGVFPECGPLSGGNSVCITGSNLHCLSEVFFNRVLITDQEFTVAPSGTFLTLVAPPATTPGPVLVHGIGLVDTFPPVTCTTSPSIPYTYYPPACPTAIRIAPPSGPATGGTAFQLFGSDLYCPTVTIGGVAVPVSADPLGECVTGVTPPHAPGNAPVVVGRTCCPPSPSRSGSLTTARPRRRGRPAVSFPHWGRPPEAIRSSSPART